MTVFQLFIYSCVSLHGLDGELMSKTCRWDARQMFTIESSCSIAGTDEMGKPIFSDIHENRVASKFRCSKINING